MKFTRMPPAEIRSHDSRAMREAITALKESGIAAKRPTDWQLKLDEITSYYPDKGTLFIDGHPAAESERGIGALKAWIDTNGPQPELQD